VIRFFFFLYYDPLTKSKFVSVVWKNIIFKGGVLDGDGGKKGKMFNFL